MAQPQPTREEMMAMIAAEERLQQEQLFKQPLYTRLTADGCPEMDALIAALPYLKMEEFLVLPKIHLAIKDPPLQIRQYFHAHLHPFMSIAARPFVPQVPPNAPPGTAPSRPEQGQIAAMNMIKYGWLVEIICSEQRDPNTAGLRLLLIPFSAVPRYLGGRDSPNPDTFQELFLILAQCVEQHPKLVAYYLARQPQALADLLAHIAVEAVADALIVMSKNLLTTTTAADVSLSQWFNDQFITAIFFALRYHKGVHDGGAGNLGRILVQLIGTSWRKDFPGSIRLQGLPAVRPKHVSLLQTIHDRQDYLQPLDRSYSSVLASLEVLTALAERPDLLAFLPARFMPACMTLLTSIEANYPGWLTHTRRDPKEAKAHNFDSELYDQLWPIYSRLVIQLLTFFHATLAHGWTAVLPTFHSTTERLPQRLLELCVRHSLNNVLHKLVDRIFSLLARSPNPELAFTPQVMTLLMSYVYIPADVKATVPATAATPVVATVRTFRSGGGIGVGFIPHWQRMASYIRDAAATNTRLFESITANSDWFDYVGSGALDDDFDKLRNTERDQEDTEAQTAELFGKGMKEMDALTKRMGEVAELMKQHQAGGVVQPRRSTVMARGSGMGSGSESKSLSKIASLDVLIRQVQEQRDTIGEVMSFQWTIMAGGKGGITIVPRQVVLKPPVAYMRGKYIAMMNKMPATVEMSTEAAQRARRLGYGSALHQLWKQQVARASGSPPVPAYREWKWVEYSIVRQSDASALPPPQPTLSPGEFALELSNPSLMMANIDQDNGRDQLAKQFALTAAAFSHFTIVATQGQIMIGDMRVQDAPDGGTMILHDCCVHANLGTYLGHTDGGPAAIQQWRAVHQKECATNPVCRWLNTPPL